MKFWTLSAITIFNVETFYVKLNFEVLNMVDKNNYLFLMFKNFTWNWILKFGTLWTIKTIFDVEKFYVKLNFEVIHNNYYFECWKILREIEQYQPFSILKFEKKWLPSPGMAFYHTRLELKQHNKEQFYLCFWSRPPWRLDTGSTGFQSLALKNCFAERKNCQKSFIYYWI